MDNQRITDWREATEIVVGRTGHKRFRQLVADEHTDHDIWRERLVAEANGVAPDARPAGPTAGQMAANLFRSMRSWIGSGFRLTPKKIRLERAAKCRVCPLISPDGLRCTDCGCFIAGKIRIALESCPKHPPEWSPYVD